MGGPSVLVGRGAEAAEATTSGTETAAAAPIEVFEHTYPSPESLFMDHYEPLARALTLVTGDADAAREAVQEAFCRLCRDWSTVSAYEHQAAWVRRVALNVLRDQQRSLSRRPRLLARLRPDPAVPPPSGVDTGLWSAVGHLPERQRTAVGLYYIADLPVSEIGAAMGVSEGTVKRHLDRARTALRKELEAS